MNSLEVTESDRPPPAQLVEDRSFDRLGLAAATAAAIRTGIFAELVRQPTTMAALVERLGLDPRATTLVLDLLVAERLVSRSGEQIGPGPALLAATSAPGGPAMALALWGHVEEFLRTGTPAMTMDQPGERERTYRSLVSGLGTLFEAPARALAARLATAPRSILDVGCGSGVWSLAIAERFPGTRVTGLDLPDVLASFTARAAAHGLTDRTATIAGDMHAVDIPTGAFDLVVIANVLRIDDPVRAEALVARIASSVAPDGAVLVVDTLSDGSPQGDRAAALYALHLGLRTRDSRVHSAATITGWLARAGFPRAAAIPLPHGGGALGALFAAHQGS